MTTRLERLESTDPNTLVVRVEAKGVGTACARLRRAVREINTFAIDRVFVYPQPDLPALKNPEEVAHRLGLVPVVFRSGISAPVRETYPHAFRSIERCECAGRMCAKCALLFTCDVREARVVTSNDFASKQEAALVPDVPICTGPAKIAAFALMRPGYSGVKWQCAAPLPYFRALVSVRVEGAPTLAQKKELVRVCPARVFALTDLEDLVVDDTKRCTVCNECRRAAHDFDTPDLVRLEVDMDRRDVVVECAGQLTPDAVWDEIQRAFGKRDDLLY